MFVSFLACRTDTNLSEVSWMGFWLQTSKLAHIHSFIEGMYSKRTNCKDQNILLHVSEEKSAKKIRM